MIYLLFKNNNYLQPRTQFKNLSFAYAKNLKLNLNYNLTT